MNDDIEEIAVETARPSNADRFTQQQLLDICSDIDSQPAWRPTSEKACAYYDGDQLPPEVVSVLKERGQPLTIHNLIGPTIDGVLGMEAKTRTDLMVIADDPDEEMEQLAEAVNAEFSDACRLGMMGKARSDAYAEQLKAGLSWVEVYRNSDPFGIKHKIECVHRNEVYFDWFSKRPDLSDCRWILRKRWVDLDEAKSLFPDKAVILDYSLNEWRGFIDTDMADSNHVALLNGYDEYQNWSRDHMEWLSKNRKRVQLQVIYYRTYQRMPVMTFPSGRVIEFDKNNLNQAIVVALGKANLTMARVSRIREAWFVGPHFIADRQCSAPQGMFPLVPFWGYRKDKNGMPYGLVARAMPAQDEVNFRRIKLTWLLQAKRVIKDTDAVNMSDARLVEELERPDGVINLNPDRHNKTTVADAIRVEQDFQVAQQQFSVMQESQKLIQDTMGIYSAFLGQDSRAQSGVAISNLVEQGATTLAEINDNYQFACNQVGTLLLCYLLDDLKKQRNRKVVINRDDPRRRKAIVLNEEQDDGIMTNDVSRLRAHIALAPIQQTPAFKSQLAQQLSQIITGLPPEAQSSVLDMWLELLDVPNKYEFIDRVRNAVGIVKSPEDMTEEEQAQLQQEQEQQAQIQQQQMELAFRELEARVVKMEAEAQHKQAQSQREISLIEAQKVKDAHIQAQTGQILQEMEGTQAEQEAIQAMFMQTVQQKIDSIPI